MSRSRRVYHPQRWRANDALAYRHNPPANERPGRALYVANVDAAWWTLNTPPKFCDSANFSFAPDTLARVDRSPRWDWNINSFVNRSRKAQLPECIVRCNEIDLRREEPWKRGPPGECTGHGGFVRDVERLISALEKKRSPRFLIYSKNYMQLPPPPSAPASASRR